VSAQSEALLILHYLHRCYEILLRVCRTEWTLLAPSHDLSEAQLHGLPAAVAVNLVYHEA
jgi:hypothetical protein